MFVRWHTCSSQYGSSPPLFEIWLTHFHISELLFDFLPSRFKQMLKEGIIRAHCLPPSFFSYWLIFNSAPPLNLSLQSRIFILDLPLSALSADSVSLTWHWVVWQRMLPQSSTDEDVGGGCVCVWDFTCERGCLSFIEVSFLYLLGVTYPRNAYQPCIWL